MVEESAEKIASQNCEDKTSGGHSFAERDKRAVLCTVAEVIFSLILHMTRPLSASLICICRAEQQLRWRPESPSKWVRFDLADVIRVHFKH